MRARIGVAQQSDGRVALSALTPLEDPEPELPGSPKVKIVNV